MLWNNGPSHDYIQNQGHLIDLVGFSERNRFHLRLMCGN